jgi:AAA+ ATPase superfamily predicted ATPase
MPLIDRESERQALHRLVMDGSPKLALLTGRRRVGKTFLLTHAWGDHDYFLFTASRVTAETNRVQLLKDLAEWSGEDIRSEDYPTWRTVFNLILDLKHPKQLVIILDEFQYLAEDGNLAAVASELNAAWERKRAPRPLLLVLSGSAVSTMEGLAGGGAPLYGRFAWQHRLRPLTYWHAAELAPFRALRDRAIAYGVFGGTPRYLAAINPEQSLARNIRDLLLAPTGEVRTLVETALDQEEGLRDVAKYRSILRAVAQGRTLRNEIAGLAGLENDRGLRLKLDRLIELGYLETRQNIDAKASDPIRYYVADPAFRFYQRFVEPNTSALERYAPDNAWTQAVEPHLDAYMGHEYERIAHQAYDRLAPELELPLVERWGRWEGRDRNRDSLEIDIVAPLLRGGLLTGSIKWNKEAIGPDVHWSHLDMLQRASRAGRRWAHQALQQDAPILYVAAGGFTPAFVKTIEEADRPITLWTLDDIYRP